MSVNSKFKGAFVGAISEMDANKEKEVSGELNNLESEINHTIGHVVDKLKHGNTNFGVNLTDTQIREILKDTFENIVHGI